VENFGVLKSKRGKVRGLRRQFEKLCDFHLSEITFGSSKGGLDG
jgi:hypothetical protein